MTVHGFHLYVAATNERLRKDSALQKKENERTCAKKPKQCVWGGTSWLVPTPEDQT